jgi:hypothetical protein
MCGVAAENRRSPSLSGISLSPTPDNWSYSNSKFTIMATSAA